MHRSFAVAINPSLGVISSLLHALIHADGDVLAAHSGDAPCVVTPHRRVEFHPQRTTVESVNRLIDGLVPAKFLRALDEIGCVGFQLEPRTEAPGAVLELIVTRSDTDARIEIRRHRGAEDDAVPSAMFDAA